MALMVPDHFKKALRRWLHLLARPARADRGRGGIVMQPYRGFGTLEESFFMGRVFYQQRRGRLFQNNPVARDAMDLLRRFFRKGIAHAQLEVHVNEARQTVESDHRGYFQVHLRHRSRGLSEHLWYPANLHLLRPRDPKFPGVRAFYWALHHGVTGGELNPMLYVSRGPWETYLKK